MTNLGKGGQPSLHTYSYSQPKHRGADKLSLVKSKPTGPYLFEGTVDALVQELQPTIPLYVIRPDILQRQAQTFVQGFKGTSMYAVKVNPDKHVLHTLYKAGIKSFDVASIEEVRLIHRVAPKATMYFMHPVKAREAIAEAYYMHGVRSYVLDCKDEMYKILQETHYAGDLTLMIRLAIKDDTSVFSLAGKFGATVEEAAELLKLGRTVSAKLGVTFHVGSQCMDPKAYRRALELCAEAVRLSGVKIDIVDAGGGFPSVYPGMVPQPLQVYFDEIHSAVADCGFADLELFCEPGRALVAEAGCLVARVEQRKGDMIYLNDGTYGGMFDAGKQFNFPFATRRVGGEAAVEGDTAYRFSGPTCDSVDMMDGPFMLPADMAEGQWVQIDGMGAYSASVRGNFNGFGRSATVFLKETK
jgi:ornithine decarboxylase